MIENGVRPPGSASIFALASALTGLGGGIALAVLAIGQRLTWDEIEFVRATEWVRQGLVPFRDFWEHHSPLQWFAFAPFKAFATGPGAATVLFMRWAQVPLWLLGLWALWRAMQRADVARWAAATAMAALLASPVFVRAAIEYRVDTLSTVLYVLALFALLNSSRSRRWAIAAGALLSLCGLANLRMGPVLAATCGLAMVFDPDAKAWRWNRGFPWLVAGALLGLLPALAYALATGALGPAWQRLIVENSLTDAQLERVPWTFWKRSLVFFAPGDALLDVDWAGVLLLFGGALGIVLALVRFARAGFVELLAIVQLVDLWFTQRMKILYPYHFEIVLLLFVPLLGAVLDRGWWRRPVPLDGRWRFDWRWLPLAMVAFAAVRNGVAVVRANERASLRYQDRIMREADRWVPPDGAVFDGVGFALNRRPAYRYWFLAGEVRVLAGSGDMEPYTVAQAIADPPGAVIFNRRLFNWLQAWPELGRHLVSHYLPLYQNLWIPALSARLDAARPAVEWTVPRTGRYVVVADSRLVEHPWFRQPLALGMVGRRWALQAEVEVAPLRRPEPRDPRLRWELDGARLAVGREPLFLQRGEKLRLALAPEGEPVAILVVPEQVSRLFTAPPEGAVLDGI